MSSWKAPPDDVFGPYGPSPQERKARSGFSGGHTGDQVATPNEALNEAEQSLDQLSGPRLLSRAKSKAVRMAGALHPMQNRPLGYQSPRYPYVLLSPFNEHHDFSIRKSSQSFPGTEHSMPDPKPVRDQLPAADGTQTAYRAAGKLEGKKALITGGDSGIGAATAVLFAKEGADSTIVYLPEEEKDAQATKQQVQDAGAHCHTIAVDLTDRQNCQKAVDFAVERMGGIDVLFNNAAYQMMVPDILDLKEEQWIHTFNTNIHSFFYVSKYALKHMKSGSTIINDASVNAYVGRPDMLDYTATKGAVVAFTRALSNQYLPKGVRVNAIAPGPVWTPLIPSTMTHEAQEDFQSPMGRPAQPSEIAACVVFLASSDSSCVSGQTLHCNGGVVVNG